MSEQSLKMKRREFIRKMGLTTGSALLTPFLDTLINQAWGQAVTKKRFLVYMHGSHFYPTFTSTTGTETNFTLNSAMAALEPYKKDMLVLRNIYNTVYPDLHGNLYATLSGVKCTGVPVTNEQAWMLAQPGAPSIDTLLSNEFGTDTRFKEMVLGYARPGQTGLAYGTQSVKTPVGNLTDAFSQYFTGLTPVSNTDALKKKSILDFAVNDIKKAYRGLASTEKAKLDEYLSSVQGIQTSIGNAVTDNSLACVNYKVPTTVKGPDGANLTPTPNYGPLGGMPWLYGKSFVSNSIVHADMMALGLSCGITRHGSMISQLGEFHQYYPEIGANLDVHADICHGLNNDGSGNATLQAHARNITNFHASQIARIYAKLKATPEGNGTAADNTLILWCSDSGGSHHYGTHDQTVVLIGNAGGTLKTGRSITYAREQYSMCEVLLTVCKAMGSTRATFGDGTNPGKNPIPGLLA